MLLNEKHHGVWPVSLNNDEKVKDLADTTIPKDNQSLFSL